MQFACTQGRLRRQTQPCFSRCHVLRLPLCPQTPGGAGGLFLSHDEWTFWPVLFGRGPSHSLLSKFTSVASGPVLTTVATGYSHHHSQATESLEIPSIDGFLGASMVQGLEPRAHQCKPQAPHRPAVNHLRFRGVPGDPWHQRRKTVAHGGLGWGRDPSVRPASGAAGGARREQWGSELSAPRSPARPPRLRVIRPHGTSIPARSGRLLHGQHGGVVESQDRTLNVMTPTPERLPAGCCQRS